MPQFGRNRARREGLSWTNDFRSGIDTGGVTEDWTAEALDDDPIVFDVEIRERAHHQHREREKDNQNGADDRIAGQQSRCLLPLVR